MKLDNNTYLDSCMITNNEEFARIWISRNFRDNYKLFFVSLHAYVLTESTVSLNNRDLITISPAGDHPYAVR